MPRREAPLTMVRAAKVRPRRVYDISEESESESERSSIDTARSRRPRGPGKGRKCWAWIRKSSNVRKVFRLLQVADPISKPLSPLQREAVYEKSTSVKYADQVHADSLGTANYHRSACRPLLGHEVSRGASLTRR